MDTISSGILSLDLELGIGGLPKNKITEISGPPDSSKSSFIFNLIKANADCTIAYIDMDNRINLSYLSQMGIDTESLIITQPTNVEQMIEIVSSLLDTKAIDIIIIDSIASIISRDEKHQPITASNNASTISDTIKKLSTLIFRSDCALVLVNQIRSDLQAKKYGAEIALADRVLNSYASIRLDIRKTNELHKYDQIIGSRLKINVVKNKLAFKRYNAVSIRHFFANGFDVTEDLLELACDAQIINKSGSWYDYITVKLQGKDAMINYLNKDHDLLEEIYDKVIEFYNL